MPHYRTPRRGEVWFAELDPAVGHEIQKTRPVVIVSSDVYNRYNWVVIGVPLTSGRAARFDQVLITPPEGGLRNPSSTQPDQIRAIDRSRLISKIGDLDPATMAEISLSLKAVLALP
jgi:mRNA interferase MazF